MKSLARWSATLGLMGCTIFGSVVGGNLDALALSQDEIVQKLSTVPVFMITDEEGKMIGLSLTPPNQEQTEQNTQPFFAVFIAQDDATAAIENLQNASPELEDKLRTVVLPLGEAYQLIRSNQEEESPPFVFVAEQEQLRSAATLLQAQEEKPELSLITVPLFHFVNREDGAYVTVSNGDNGTQKIPLFFDKEEAQRLLETIQQRQSDSDVEIKVSFLHQWIRVFENSDDEALNLIELVPLPESAEFVRKFLTELQQRQQQQQQQQ